MAAAIDCGRCHWPHPQLVTGPFRTRIAPRILVTRDRVRRSARESEKYRRLAGSCKLLYSNISLGAILPGFRKSKDGRIATRFASCSEVIEEDQAEENRPPFDLNLAVLLAGFAFESYNTPPESLGVRETDGFDCETVYPTKEFVQSIYDGQLLVKLNKGLELPGLDLWGSSDPYVEFRIGDCFARSRTIWASRDPVWNENLALNVKVSAGKDLQVAVWDANLVSAPRRLGNISISLENVCDGKWHKLGVKLQGMGGGGMLFFKVQFQTFVQLDSERAQFSFASLFSGEFLEDSFKSIFGSNSVRVTEFLEFFRSSQEKERNVSNIANVLSAKEGASGSQTEVLDTPSRSTQSTVLQKTSEQETRGKDEELEIWGMLAETFSQTLKPFGIDASKLFMDEKCQEAVEDMKRFGLESQKRAEIMYAKDGLAVVEDTKVESGLSTSEEGNKSGLGQVTTEKNLLEGVMKQTEGILGAWAMVSKSLGGESSSDREETTESKPGKIITTLRNSLDSNSVTAENQEILDPQLKEKATMFSTAESAMEAWALLATAMGGTSLVKSDFEKICFIENNRTDTQAVIWRDSQRKRVVVAFRGTEQTKWKDMVTDLSILAIGFNPERIANGKSLENEPLVHKGFLMAYDSVKSRLLSLVRASIDHSNIDVQGGRKWHIYVTGHSLGGALATLFALELSSSKLAKDFQLQVSMYNFGSPRVGNQSFANKYNKIVKDSWRVVNHRDIVPTIPRLMGYCHVAQPIYLSAQQSSMVESNLLDDGYNGDVIGESTPDIIFHKFMKGEQKILERLIDTEITMLRAMRDGTAVMQHMEDFYFITLLQRVESRILLSKKVNY